jgi:hypothetical protein
VKDGQSKADAVAGHAAKHGSGGDKATSHAIALPKNPKRLTIDQAHQAMAQMGYKAAEIAAMSPRDIKEKVYAGAKTPGQVGAAKRNPAERSLAEEEVARALPGEPFRGGD